MSKKKEIKVEPQPVKKIDELQRRMMEGDGDKPVLHSDIPRSGLLHKILESSLKTNELLEALIKKLEKK